MIKLIVSVKILELRNGNFRNDKQLKGKHKGKFRKRAGDYRIIYLKENNYLLITKTRRKALSFNSGYIRR